MRKVLAALTLAIGVASCGLLGPAPMAPQEARAFLQRVEAGQVDLCVADGRNGLRSAVRGLSAEAAGRGESWPDFIGALGSSTQVGEDEVIVAIGLASGVVRSGDLSGRSRTMARMVELGLERHPQGRVFREGLALACPETMQAHRLFVTHRLDQARLRRMAEAARDRRDGARVQQLVRVIERRERAMQQQMAMLAEVIGRRIDEVKRRRA